MSLNSQSKEIKHQVSGGFKIPFDLLTKNNPIKTSEPVTKQTDNKNISHLLTKSEILQQVGLNPNTKDLDLPIDFEDLKEKGIYGLKSKKDIADAVIKDIEKKIEKIKNGRSEMQQKLLEKRKRKEELAAKASKDDVIIFDGDERKQYASHILSTLEVHSVENVEALIKAHHRELQSLERQYFSSRSNSNAYSGIPNKSWSSYSKYKKPYKFTQQYNKVTSKPMTKAEYLHHYQAYQYEKHNKNQQKPQKINKKSKNFILDPDFDRYQPTSPNPKRSKSPPKSRKKELYQNEEPNSPSKLEKPLIQYFFQKIPKAASHTNPSKSELLKFLIKNIQILELYNLDAETLNKELNEYSNNNFMSFEEFSHFLKSKKEKNNDQQIENTYLLDNKYLTRMKDIFNEVDSYKDGVVKLSLFIEKLRNDQKISKILEFQTLYLPAIDKTLTLNQVFKQMEQEAIIAKGEKNYITWEQFEKYFIEHKIKDKFLLSKVRILKAKNLITKTEGDDNTIDLDRHLKQLLKDTFDKTPKKKDSKKETTGFVKTFDLLENIRGNENFWKYERENVRKKGENYSLKDETLGELLVRIENEAPEYLVWNDFFDYFTRKGRPNFLAKKEKEENNRLQELFIPPNIEDYEEEYQKKAIKNIKSLSPTRHSIDSPYKLKERFTEFN